MLTDSYVKKLKPNPQKRIAVSDGYGLQIRITPNGKKTWSYQYTFHSSKKKLTLGSFPSVNCKEARRLANEARYKIAKGIDPQAEKKRPTEEKITFASAWEAFDNLFLERSVKYRTAKEYRRLISIFFDKPLGNKPIEAIQKSDIIKIIDHIGKQTPTQANRCLAVINKFFNWCVGRSYLNHNPAHKIPKVIREIPRERILQIKEMREIYKACVHLSDGNRLLVSLMLLTGQRRDTIAKLRPEDVINGFIELPGSRNKSGSRIRIPLSNAAQEMIEKFGVMNGEYLVSTTNGQKPISGFSKLKTRIDQMVDLDDWRFHDFRRGIATFLEDRGIDRFYVQRILSHKDSSVTGIYARSNHTDFLKAVFNQWAEVITNDEIKNEDNIVFFQGKAG